MQPESEPYLNTAWCPPLPEGDTASPAVRRPSAAQYTTAGPFDLAYGSLYPRRQSEPEQSSGYSLSDHSFGSQHPQYSINTPLHVNTQLGTPAQSLLSGVGLSTPQTATPSTLPPLDAENTLQPTWHGFVHTAWDAAMVVEACLDGTLGHCPRRPHDRERAHVIKSGSVFVYEALASGIKRWTDGLTWSPSRINGNFLVYRELNDSVQQGSKRRTAKRSRLTNSREASSTNLNGAYTDSAPRSTSNEDRPYIGSLSDSYDFKPGGLVKKTISFTVQNSTHHVICYYTLEDAKSGTLPRPGHDSRVCCKEPRRELREPRNFKAGPHHPDDNLAFYQVMPPYPQQASQYYPVSQAYAAAMVQQTYAPTALQTTQSMMIQGQPYSDDGHLRYDYP